MQKHVMKLFSQPTADWFSDTFGMPTRVQEEAWAAIAKDKDVLVSAPTGTGKTLSAFLIFIDRLNALAAGGDLKEELYLLYVSPLKSLAGDIRENLRRPLDGIPKKAGQPEIVAAMRTGDTPQDDKTPSPHLDHNAGITLSDADVKGRAGNTQDGESGYPG